MARRSCMAEKFVESMLIVFFSFCRSNCYQFYFQIKGGPPKKAEVIKKLTALRNETDLTLFKTILNSSLTLWEGESEMQNFLKYFKKEYIGKEELWATCHRLHLHVNTNMHVEVMHKEIKYSFLKGKKWAAYIISLCSFVMFILQEKKD